MTNTKDDPTPLNDTIIGKTGHAFNAAQLITMACHGVANTVFTWPADAGKKPDWFDGLEAKLAVAQGLAREWLTGDGTGKYPKGMAEAVTSTIPMQVLDFQPTFDAVTGNILQIVKDHGSESGKDNQYVVQIKDMISQGLVPQINTSIAAIDEMGNDLAAWGTKIQAAHNDLASGASSIQSAEIALQGDIDAMNSAIKNLHTYIDNENKAIAASAAAIGIGIFALIVGIALAPETGGASLAIGGFIGAAGIIGGSVTWGVMQGKINEQFKEIAQDQAKKASDQRTIIALQGLSTASGGAVSNLNLASSALSKLQTQWGAFEKELQGVLSKLEKAEDSISVMMQGVFTQAAKTEWADAATTANALVNRKVDTTTKTLSMDSSKAA